MRTPRSVPRMPPRVPPPRVPPPRAEHLVLVTVDALRPAFYLDERWPSPAMRALVREGAHALAVRSVFPALTFPAHTTLVTGALPARHGVVHDTRFVPGDEEGPWYGEASAIRVPALWDAVRATGGTTAAVNWPVSVGAAVDWNVPDLWPRGGQAARLDAIRRACHPRGLLEELEREATGRLRPETFTTRLVVHDLRAGLMAAYLFERYRPTLLLVHLASAVQVFQEPGGWTNPRTLQAIGTADQAISLLVETIERLRLRDRTAVVVTGDHGVVPVHTEVRPNAWLVEAGLRPERIPEEGGPEGVGLAAWRATFHALAGAAFLRVRESVDESEETSRAAETVAAVRRLLDGLPRATRAMFRVVDRAELDALGAYPEAPLALAAAPGFEFGYEPVPPAIRPHATMTHGHHPDEPAMHTGFIGAGAGFRRGAVAPLLPLECIAPLVAAALGLPFDAPDGAPYPGLLAD